MDIDKEAEYIIDEVALFAVLRQMSVQAEQLLACGDETRALQISEWLRLIREAIGAPPE
jgi:hypothetical protein